jgi:hypothetical protein
MRRQAGVVLLAILFFAGASSAAIVSRSQRASSSAASAVQHEKRLGPKPMPRWYWRWVEWRLGEGYAQGHAQQADLRPTRAPHRIPAWAWQRLHYFLVARRLQASRKNHGPRTRTSTATTTATTTTTTTTSTTPTPSSGGTPGEGVLEYGGNLTTVANPDLYSMVIGSAWTADAASVVANTPGRGLVYFDGTDLRTDYSTGVTYTQAQSSGWILQCGTSACQNSTYGSYGADVGSASYQRAWISNVLDYLANHPGVDGVFIDNVVYDPKSDFGSYPNKYPDTASWSAAMVSFVQAVYPALHAKGYYVAENAGAYKSGDSTYSDGTSTVNWWNTVGPNADGLMNESYEETSQGPRTSAVAWTGYFDGWQRLIGVAQSQGDDFIGLTKGSATDPALMTYGKASFLLEWNGGGSVFIYKSGSTDPTNGAWTTDIGTPTAAKVQVGIGWERGFTRGTVLVNPSPSVSQTFTVNGTDYTLAPTTARILTNS